MGREISRAEILPFLPVAFERFDVRQVLGPAGGELIFDEMLFRKHADSLVRKFQHQRRFGKRRRALKDRLPLDRATEHRMRGGLQSLVLRFLGKGAPKRLNLGLRGRARARPTRGPRPRETQLAGR